MRVTTLSLFLFLAFLQFADIINEDIPAKGEWDLKPSKVWEVSTYGKKHMALPNVGAVLDDGSLCIYDYKRRLNYIFNKNGENIASFGKKGEGPGEVKFQSNVLGIDEKFIVLDYSRIHYFTAKGVFLKTVLLSLDLGMPELFINDEEYISVLSDSNKAEIKRVNLTRKSAQSICKIPDYIRGQFPSQERMITIVIPPLTPRYEFDFDFKNNILYYGVNNRYRIFESDLSGTTQNMITLKRSQRMLDRKMKKKINKEMNLSKKMWDRLPKTLNQFAKIQVTDDFLLVYVQKFEEFFPEQQIDVFSKNGQYLYRMFFRPGSGEEIHSNMDYQLIIKNSYLYAAIQDQDGEMKVVKYKISLPLVR